MSMESIWKEYFEVKSYSVDFQQQLKPSALMQFFQEVATNHAASLGAGYDPLMEKGLFWALSRLKVEITRMPLIDEKICIETWPCGYEGLFFRRDFIIYDQEQNVLARGISAWLLLAVKTLRPQRPNVLTIDIPTNDGKRALADFPDRLMTQTVRTAYLKTIGYNEIDLNLHVNNTRYVDWATDCFQLDQYQNFNLIGFSLEFLAETHWGDEIELRIGEDPVDADVEVIDQATQLPLFRAVLKWKSKTN